MRLTPFCSQPPAASRCIAVLVTSVLASRERAGGCRLVILHAVARVRTKPNLQVMTNHLKLMCRLKLMCTSVSEQAREAVSPQNLDEKIIYITNINRKYY